MEVMDESLSNAAKDGDLVRFVEEARINELESGCCEEYFLRQTSNKKKNILHLAIRFRQNEFIKKVLEKGELLPKAVTDQLIKQPDIDRDTPLHGAAKWGNVNILKLVYEYDNEQAKVKNGDGNTPLHVAVKYGKVENARLLIKQHPELASVTNNDGNNLLHLAAENSNVEIARLLLLDEQLPQLASVTNNVGNTPLHVAVMYGEVENARLLIKQHPELTSVTNNDGNNLLHLAAEDSNVEIARLLLLDEQHPELARILIDHHHEMTRATNKLNETPLHLAIKNYKQTISEWKWYTDFEQKYGYSTNNATLWLEKMTSELNGLTKLLLEKDSSVLCVRDENNMTPLYEAASLIPSFGVKVVNMISEYCPESVMEQDYLGRTILHYMIDYVTSYKTGKELLELEVINELKNCKDGAGNTPLDLAWKKNIKMVRALLDSSSQQNVHDSTSTCAVVQKTNDFEMIRKRRKTMEEYGVVDGVHLEFLRSKLSKFRNDFLFSRDSNGRNLLHNLMQLERGSPIDFEEFHTFILEVVDIQPKLVCQTDHNRETPVHILMRNSLHTKIRIKSESGKQIETLGSHVEELIDLCCKYFHVAKGAKANANFKYELPWLVQNVDGNTPLHEAIKANHIGPIWNTLSRLEIETTAKLTNKHNETPLHLLAGCSTVEWSPEIMIVDLVKANPKAAFSRDENGLTPMMRAIQVGNISTFQILFDLYFRAGDQMVDNKHAQLYKVIEEATNKYLVEEKDDIISGFAEEMAREKDRIKSKINKIKAHQYDLAKKLLTKNNGCTLWHMLLNQPPTKAEKLVEGIEVKLLIQMLKEADKEGVPQLKERLEEADKDRKMLLELIERFKDGDKEGKTLLQLIERLQEGDEEGKTLLQLIERLQEGDQEGKTLSNMIELLKEADNEGITPSNMIELLKEADNEGITPSNMIELLIEAGKQGKKPWHLIRLLKVADEQGKTLSQLTELMENGDDKHGKMLLSHLIKLLNEAQYYLAKKLLSDNNGCSLWHMLLNQPPSKAEKFVEDTEIKLLDHEEGVPQLIELLKEADKEEKTLLQLMESLKKHNKEGKTQSHLIELLKKGDKQGITPQRLIKLLNECDKQGKIPLHLIELLKEKDKEGKTPLHLALERRLYKHTYYFLNWSCSLKGDEGFKKMKELLDENDDDGNKPCDILASLTDFPKQLENFFKDKCPQLIGYRSIYGISTTEMKDYVSTMGVIAALLTTITFTAAFTVPGGAIQDNKDENLIGTPLLVHTAAFQAFMFFDILTLCLSTMVLFCLLWILAAGTKSNSVMLMDFSILLLSVSFHTTLLTFMTGVYATTIHVKPWIAIYSLVLCSLLIIIIMRRYIVVELLAPCGHKIFLHSDTRAKIWMKRICPNLFLKKLRKE